MKLERHALALALQRLCAFDVGAIKLQQFAIDRKEVCSSACSGPVFLQNSLSSTCPFAMSSPLTAAHAEWPKGVKPSTPGMTDSAQRQSGWSAVERGCGTHFAKSGDV